MGMGTEAGSLGGKWSSARHFAKLGDVNPEGLLQELETAATKLGVRLSYEALAASVGLGGLCRVKGKYRIIIDKRAGTEERIATLAEALSALDHTQVELPDPVRGLLEFYSVSRAS
jgi:hypothetical protein